LRADSHLPIFIGTLHFRWGRCILVEVVATSLRSLRFRCPIGVALKKNSQMQINLKLCLVRLIKNITPFLGWSMAIGPITIGPSVLTCLPSACHYVGQVDVALTAKFVNSKLLFGNKRIQTFTIGEF
jgi:hypothetical protein